MKHELSALIADYKAGRVGAREIGGLLRDLRDRTGEPRPAGESSHPLSEGQRGLWALQRAYPDMAAYNVPLCFRVSGLDAAVFQDACRALLVRHPALSTVIRQDAGEPKQSFDPARALDFATVDLTDTRDEGEALAAVEHASKQVFSLGGAAGQDGDRLFRVRVFDRPAGECIVLIVVHHIVFDGTSANLVLSTLFEEYEARLNGAPAASRNPEDAAGFHDFVREERRTLAGRTAERLPYWRERLAAPLPVLDLPADRPHTALADRFAGKTLVTEVPAGLAARVAEFAAARRTFVSTAMLTAYAATLATYSDARELVVGMPVNERDDALARTVGLMINMVPVRVALPPDEPFEQLVTRAQRDVSDDLLHGHPFPALVRELAPDTPAGRSPVFQTAFVFQDVLDGIADADRPYRLVEELHQEGEYELSVEVWPGGGGYALYWKYQPELYGHAFVEELASRFLDVLAVACEEPRTTVAALRRRSGERCVQDLVDETARRTPDAVAVAGQEEILTYEALGARSAALASCLVARGVRRGDLVAVLLDRSPDLVVALLGILKAGAAYVPLDPELPVARLTDIVTDSGAPLIVTQARYEARARGLADGSGTAAPELFVLDEEQDALAAALGTGPVAVPVTADDLAYVIYTSGSTGRPKGVMIPHRGFTNLLGSLRREPGMTAADTLFAVTTVSFDMAQVELLLPLVCGARVHVCDGPAVKDVERLKERIARVRPTVMQATPATWSMLFHSGWRNPEGVRVFCGGEALPRTLKEFFRDTGTEAWNLYGPTETTVYSTGGLVRHDRPTTIGKPVAHTRVHILDERLRPVPHGETGELCIAGKGLAKGYVGRPDLTAEKFVDHDLVPGGKLYRTGDLARWTEDGEIDYLGRMDFQVKIRGYRIELGDIEYHLGRHQGVAECVVVARGEDGAKQLVAYYVPRGAGVRADAFKEHLRALLPAYMVPDFYVPLDAVPLTDSGKVDRTALMRREVSAAPAPAARTERSGQPSRDVERDVLACWQEVLEVRDLTPSVSFFESGGNSLSAVVLADLISRRLGVPFAAADLFKYATPADVAAHVREQAPDHAEHEEPLSVASAPVREPEPQRASLPEDAVAVVGISCRFPDARDHWEFWENLKRGHASAGRWSEAELRAAGVPERVLRDPDFVPLRSGLDGKEEFDGAFFRLSPQHVELMDPQFRQVLLHAWKAVEDAGRDHREIPNTGVYVSTGNHHYGAPDDTGETPAAVIEDPRQYLSWVMSQSGTVASMVSYQLGFGGPSMSVHSNCSSSLSALALAARAVQTGETDFALVAAASANSVDGLGYVHKAGLNLSGDGRVKAFDADADGMAGGEGVVALLVRRAADAVADGDHIYGLLRGIGVNNDGGDATGFYSPSVNGQSRLIRQVLDRTGVDPRTIGYVEAHGTGTKLGDPVEVAALTEAYRAFTDDTGYCGIGSVKTNLGHLDTAAGLAGCVKVLLSLYHGQLPPTLHYREPNPQLRLETSPFHVVDWLRDWPAGTGPRRAAQSSIGLGGTNAHAVFEEYVRTADAPARADGAGARQLVPLSARTRDDLVRAAAALCRHLTGPRAAALRLDDVAHTLRTGRVAMACRVAFVVRDLERLAAELEAFVRAPDGDDTARRFTGPAAGSTEGAARKHTARLARALADGKLKKAAKAWARGADADWSRLTGQRPARRVSLPGYAFAPVAHPYPARAPHARAAAPRPGETPGTPLAHPLLHENVSRFDEQRYRSDFTGDEFVLRDHVVDGKKLLPAVASLEMACTAVRRALPEAPGRRIVVRSVTWARPVVVGDGGRQVEFTLTRDDTSPSGPLGFALLTDGDQVCVQGRAITEAAAPPPRVDLGDLRDRLRLTPLAGEDVYAHIARAGVAYGAGFRLVHVLHRGERDGRREVLAELRLPAHLRATADAYALHPSFLDAAVHASLGLDPAFDSATAVPVADGTMRVPFALDRLDAHAPFDETMYAWVRPAARRATGAERVLDIDLVDPAGRVCATLRGLAYRALTAPGRREPARPEAARASELRTLLPVWEPRHPAEAPAPADSPRGAVLVLDADRRLRAELAALHPGHQRVDLPDGASVDDIAALIRTACAAVGGRIARIVWVAPAEHPDGMVQGQERGAVEVFRIVKALLALGHGTRDLAWSLYTFGTQLVRDHDPVAATHASVHGLAGSLAQEHTRWTVDLVDLPHPDSGDRVGDRLGEERHLTGVRPGTTVALRGGRWFSQELLPTTAPEPAAGPYRHGGVYVVIGGAGGIGELWSRYMVDRYRATIVWIGRRPLTDAVGRSLADLAERARAAGAAAPSYVQADARDHESLRAAHARIKRDHPRVDGVVHSAIVLADKTLAHMDEDRFRAALTAKADVGVRVADVFGAEPLDFLLFFSSVESLVRAPGQANYAAGCTFKDALAHALNQRGTTVAKTVNWGYWGVAGVVSDSFYRERMAAAGVDSLDPDEAFTALESFLAGEHGQIALMRTFGDEALRGLALDERQGRHRPALPSVRDAVVAAHRAPHGEVERLRRFLPHPRMRELTLHLLYATLRDLGAERPDRTGHRVLPRYARWLAESHRLFAEAGPALAAHDLDSAELWRQWRADRDGWQAGDNQRAQTDLVESCLEALPDVLTGARKGTEILFPGSSLSRVEGVYRGDPVVDYFNDRLSVLLADAVRAWSAAEPGRRLRILEVGAGTGATSVKVLQALEPFGDRIVEYHYTDLSKAFLFRAEERLKPRYPHLTTGIFNAEHAPGPQGVDLGGFDVVVATNVLHATADISRTLRNVKATLREGGLLLLNEMSRNTLLAHVTFGLTDGWWRFRDAALRIPGSPVLSAESWREVLEDEGFRTGVQPDTEAHALGQMLLVAESDGRFRTTDAPRTPSAQAAPRPAASSSGTRHEPAVAAPLADDEAELRARTAGYFERLLREALHLADENLDPAKDLHDYGLDSILVSGMNSTVARDFADVSSTLFFELRTLDELVEHFVERRRPELRTLFGFGSRATDSAQTERVEGARGSDASLTDQAVAYVTGLVAETLKLDPERFDADADLFGLGLDSILVVQLNNTLGRDFEDLSSTLFFDHSTVRDVAAYFTETHAARLAEVLGTAAPAAPPREDTHPAPVSTEVREVRSTPEARRGPERQSADIAVVGLAGRYPGAESPARLWENLTRGESATAPYPADRWWCDWQGGERPWGGFLDEVASFDAAYFGIDEREAAAMDPQERLFIETAHGAVQDAGYTPAALAGHGRVGVFVGVMNATYNGRTAYSSIANRTSYLFDFQGPSVAVDTACSGSLTALHLAVQSLLSGDSACAVAGGVNLVLNTDHFDVLREHGLLSSGERCRPFSEHADGFLVAEGVGAVVLRPLRDAVAAGDHVYGVIKGSAVNSGGRTSRYSMPSLDAQRDVVTRALTRAGVTPDTVSYVEAHGTATPLGDSLEISALSRAFAGDRPGQYCAVGSLKSNLGHCESASGIAGLTKVLMQLRHGMLAPSINAEDLNTGIVFKQSPFHVQRELAPWNPVDADGRPLPRRAGLSCFGAGGSNAHLIIEGYENMPDDEARTDEACLVPLSAHTPEQLRTAAGRLAAHLGDAERERRPLPLSDLAYTLQTGRDELPVRLALVVRSTTELTAALAEFSEHGVAGPGRYADLTSTSTSTSTGTGTRPAAGGVAGDPHAAARAWLTGASVPWGELYAGRPPRRVSLPTYPFARRAHWYEPAGHGDEPAAGALPRADEPASGTSGGAHPEPRPASGTADLRAWLRAALADELDAAPHEVATGREFAALGVSSMGLVRLARRVRDELHADFASAVLFEHRTVDALAAHLGGLLPPVVRIPDEADAFVPHPLSEGQRGLWSLHRSAPDASVYNVPLCFEVAGLDLRALRTAFDGVRVRHPLLAAIVRRDGDRLVFARPETARASLTEHELTATDRGEVRARLRAHAREPFDLENGPLCRLSVFHGAPGTDTSWVLLNAHHLVLDGASAVILVKDLLAAYRSAAEGAAPPPAAASAPYAEFVAAEAGLLAGDEGAARLAFWRGQLAALPPVPAFPTDRPRSAPERGRHGATEVRRLPADLGDRVARFARERGVYASAVFLAAHQVLLRQYTQQDDLVVGMPVSTRPGGGFDGTVGHFVTMVPVRTKMSGGRTFAELCADVQGTLLDALTHAYPFGPLVRELGLGTADGSAPVFRHAFMYQDWHEDVTAKTPGVRYVEGIHQEGEYELVVEVIEPHAAEDAYTVKAKYDPALFDAATVDRLLRQYAHLLESAPAMDPRRPLDDCSAASPQELHTLAVEWNDTAVTQPERCVHELFAEQAARTPDAVALVAGTESVTYARLDERTRALAARLRATGVGPGRLVAVYLERSADLVVALLATLRAGGAYIPLDPDYPRERIAHILDDAAPAVLLTHTALRARSADLDRPGQRLLVLDDPGADPAAEEPGEGAAPGAEDPAYVIYTSGSTGLPKGVVVPHRALTNFLCAMAKRPGLGAADRVLAVTTHSFDIAALELYLPLVTGAECHLSDPATARSGDRLAALIARVRPTVMQATPATWTMLLHAGWTNAEGLRVLCGGEALSASLAERLTGLGGEVWNLFGPTETTVWSTVARVEAGRRVTIGHPIDNTRIHILDKRGTTAPVGVPGELCIAGDGLALGYLNKPELTAERFPADPFAPGGRLYRTGDLARRLADGAIECLGRIDSQVKVRGFRVEPGEVEHALTRHPAVRECAVVARAEPATGATQLVAYWTGTDATARELTEHLRRTLPAYMVPAFVLPVEGLPQTPNGKVDRLALARRPITLPDEPAAEPGAARQPADGAVRESDVLAVWRDVLGIAGLRPTDAFLDAGGNSVLAVVLADRVAERFGVPFTSADVFGCVDAAGTAARLRKDLGAERRPDAEARTGHVPRAEHAAPATPELPAHLEGSVAVIGVSVGLPGADDHRAFWRNLVAGTESVELCTADELRRLGVDEDLIQDPAYVPVRASMRGKGHFDHTFFQVSARDAELMDPQARQLLQHAWKAVEDAAYLPDDIADAAVYMSTANSLYQAPVTGPGTRRDSEALVGFLQAQPGTVPTTVSHRLGLRGPSLFVHSNCSSSLAGLALACQGIQSGQTTHALVGGCAMYGEETVGYLYEEGMTLSPDGHCKPFAADARGMVGGEGTVVVLLKDARAAVRDGDHIHALVRGVGMNNDGARKAGYYAPSLTGQSELIASVLDRAGVRAESVRYLEAHGTGTVIGDPVEVNAVSEAFRRHTRATGFCGIGSVKANLGHLDAAAGLAGLVKSALVLSHRTVPPTINHEAPNPQIDFANSPFHVVDRLTPLPPSDEPLRAAVSSFGIGGTNVHAVLEEAPPREGPGADLPGPHLVPLSARTPDALRRYARALARHLTDERDAHLADVAFTFQVGRTAMPCRAAFLAGTVAELVEALADFAERGQVPAPAPGALDVLDDDDRRALLDQWLAERRLDKAARLWEAGEPVDWRRLYADGPRPRRLSLPAYPFDERHFWLRAEQPRPARDAAAPHLFEERWVARTAAPVADAAARRVVAVFLSDPAAQDAYRAAALRHAPGTRLVFLARAGSPERAPATGTPEQPAAELPEYRVDPADEHALARGLTAVAEAHGPVDALHYLWPTERVDGGPPLRELADVGVLVRALAATGRPVPDALVAGHFDNAVEQAALDALIGYERSLSGPLPGTALRVVLHEGAAPASRWAELLLTEQHQEPRTAALYRGGQRHVCGVRSLPDTAAPAAGALREGGTYLITGAFGGLGRRVAEHLARGYRANLVLLGRSPLSPPDETWAAGLGEYGGAVVCRRADVTDEDALVEALSTLPPALRAIDGVVHAAGTAQRHAVTDSTREAARRVLAAKVDGTLALERALARTPAGRSAEFVCLFSSSSATLGDFGSCDYAVANRFQSAYARALAERGGRRLLAIAWPLWEDGGMGAAAQRAADHDHVTAYLAASGQRPLTAGTALAVLERLLAERPGTAAPLVLHAPAEQARALAERAVTPAPRRPEPLAAAAVATDPAPTRESAVARDRRHAALADTVREVVAHVLKSPVDELDDDSGFHDLGLDSIRLTQLAHRLAERLGAPLQPTDLYDHPSVRRLTDHLVDEPGVRLPASAEPVAAPAGPRPPAPEAGRTGSGTDAIAVIGMSGIFPGCRDVDAFWTALADGKDLVRELPPARFGAARDGDEGTPRPYRWMGSIDWADEFDAAFFEIAPKEARALDPRQRHLLQECWKALEDAALGAQELAGLRVGVFVGVEQGDYQLLDGAGGNLTSNHDGVLAARLSYFLDLKGPVLAVNTSCSSGLVALHQARASLLQGECDIAVVAAANFVLTPQALAAMSDAGMLSAAGRCATFDQDADGMVPGEAVTALVLRPLADAETAGDPVHSVIAASGLNYDGRTNGITAPSGDAQRELLESVYERGGIDPAHLGYVVTHGTGTKLGDPVEVGALRAAFARYTDERGFCALTSTKPNVGHTFAASGLVGLVCLSEALRHRAIPPSLHCERDNEYIDWSTSPFYVNKATKEWPAPRRGHRTGAVSAFGMSGTNAHVVVREYTGRPDTAAPTRPAYLLPVSAKTDTALEGIVDALLDRIASGALTDTDLPRLSTTLLTGRHHFRHRCALVVASLDEAAELWRAWRRSRTAVPGACFEGVVPRGFTARAQDADRLQAAADRARDTGLDPAARREALVEVAHGYVAGHTVPTAVARPDGRRVTRLRLPAYPFARSRYWVRAEQQAPAPAVVTTAEQSPPPAAPAAPPAPRKPVVLRDLADVPHRIDTADAAPAAAKPQVSLTSASPRPEPEPEAPSVCPVTLEHDVLEDLKAAADLDFGGMVATLNRTGVMVERLIPYSEEFAEYAGNSGGEALDLGCAYGVASIAALERGARVVALDMEQKHLDILGQRVNDEARQRLSLRRGMLPDVDFEAGRFTAVHASRVMHFLAPDDFRLTLRKMYDWLAPGGKVFLSSDSPYFGYWASKAADYEARRDAGDPWPGYIDDVAAHFEAAHVVGGPPLINAIDPEVFRRECEAAGFVVERAGFFGAVGVDRESYGAPAPDMEHVGIIASKPEGPVSPSTAAATSADGNRIHYRVRGDGPTALVLIHGLGCDASYWDRQLEHFADRFTVVAPDLAGHGGSGRSRQRWTVEAFAEDVVAVVEQEGLDDVILVGHSLGGPVMVAAERLLGGRVRGLIGVDTLHNFEPKVLSAEQLDRFVRTFSEQPGQARELFLDGARDDLVALVERTREETGAAVVDGAFREMLTYLQDVPKHVDVPLVLINSTSWMPTNLTAARRYGVEVELVDGVGHFVMLEAPLTFNAILRRRLEQLAPDVAAGQHGSGRPGAAAEGADS
ncbi:amino acid adenylation domain-containing protein [Streptomyces coeruleorubidus]|uniref:amino acid adenylation domain-containing protein n=1 Tax=Streptomyces coeruleorubidus TaxID=116188 RepID=UPI0033C6B034